MKTHEVIWSYSNDCYIARLFVGLSCVSSLFVGSLDECNAFIKNNTNC
jgi:hypothetical protein